MRKFAYTKSFTVDNLNYEMVVTFQNEISFSLVGGRFPNGKLVLFHEDTFYPNASKYCINNNCKNPRRVIKEFLRQILEFVYANDPPFIQFCSMEENRTRIYQKLLKHMPPRYQSLSYGKDQGNFIIYRSAA